MTQEKSVMRNMLKHIMSTIQNMMNPFDPTLDREGLYHITSGQVASEAIVTDLHEAKDKR